MTYEIDEPETKAKCVKAPTCIPKRRTPQEEQLRLARTQFIQAMKNSAPAVRDLAAKALERLSKETQSQKHGNPISSALNLLTSMLKCGSKPKA